MLMLVCLETYYGISYPIHSWYLVYIAYEKEIEYGFGQYQDYKYHLHFLI